MVRNAVQIVQNWLWLIFKRNRVGAHIQTFNWVANLIVDLLLACDLGVCKVKEATTARTSLATRFLSETLELDDHNLGHFVDFHLFLAISVVFAHFAIVLIVTSQKIGVRVPIKARLQSNA